MTLHLLEAVRAEAPEAAVVVVGSCELYGPPATLPVDESAPLRPQNPYAVSKASADLLAGFYADAHGLRIDPRAGVQPLRARAGADLRDRRRSRASSPPGWRRATIRCGSSPATRPRGATTPTCATSCARTGCSRRARRRAIYNVCSGRPASAAELVEALGRVAGVGVSHEVDPKLRRAHEVMEVRGSYERLHGATGWEPEIPLEQTLADTVAWWREEIRAGRAGARVHE